MASPYTVYLCHTLGRETHTASRKGSVHVGCESCRARDTELSIYQQPAARAPAPAAPQARPPWPPPRPTPCRTCARPAPGRPGSAHRPHSRPSFPKRLPKKLLVN
eukprot:scaffold101037_cov63-Phaeocystis_antarctica.AAC.2